MDLRWFPPSTRPVKPSEFVLVPLALICTSSFLLPSSRTRVLLTLPPLLYLLAKARCTTSGINAGDYIFAINVAGVTYRYVAHVLLTTPESHVHRVVLSGEKKGMKELEDPRTMDLWSKLKWSTHFWSSMRGVGWNWQVKNVDDVPERLQSKIPFMKSQILGLLRSYIVVDLVGHYIRASPYGQGVDAPPLFSDSLSQQILFGWLSAIRSYFDMAIGYQTCSLLGVGLGLTEPALWPPMFGSFTQAYTMRKLWGYCWHQSCRILFQGPCNFILSVFRIQKGSFLSRYAQLYVSFFISASIHHIGALNAPYVPTVKHQFLFFMLQPVAITFEDHVIHIGKKLGIRPSSMLTISILIFGWPLTLVRVVLTRTAGYLWVFGFLSFSLRYLASYGFQLGQGSVENPLVWSIADRVL